MGSNIEKLSRISGFRLISDLGKYFGVDVLKLKQLLQLFLLVPCKLFCSQNRFVISWKVRIRVLCGESHIIVGVILLFGISFACQRMWELGWRLITNVDALWVHVLRSKYGCILTNLFPHWVVLIMDQKFGEEEDGLLVMGGMYSFGGIVGSLQGLLLWMLLGKMYLLRDNEILEDLNRLFPDETITHVLKDCVNARLIWQNISPSLL
ncbi:hypothetical protein CR513_56023, partial [Mucuna pruriens]